MRKGLTTATAFLMSLMLLLGSIPAPAWAAEITEQTESEIVEETAESVIAAETAEEAVTEEIIEGDASDYILQAGGFAQAEDDVQEQPTGAKKAMSLKAAAETAVTDADAVLDLLFEKAQEWDGESLTIEVPMGDVVWLTEDVEAIYSEFVNYYPEFFFLTGGYSISIRDGKVSKIFMKCDNETYSLEDVTAFNDAASSILSQVEDGWSDEQKALFIHDYLVTHCEYDLTYSNYSAYHALVTGSSVCQGYALAYYYLLWECGIENTVISSRAMNHAWNRVLIDGQYYYVDCTWDDPTASETAVLYQDYCGHTNFLRSQEGIIETGHDSTDWVDQSGAAVYDTETGSQFEGAWWNGTITAIPHIGDLWAYAPEDNSVIYVHDYAAGSDTELATIEASWPDMDQEGYYYTTTYIHLADFDGNFYASSEDKIYKIGTDGTIEEIYELTEEELAAGRIYGIRIEGEYLYYRLYTSQDSETFALENRINLASHEHVWDEGIVTKEASCTKEGVRTYTCAVCGQTKTEAIAATGHTEVIDPAEEATCTKEGHTIFSHCSVCGIILTRPEVIPAKGHSWGEPVTTKEPTTEEEGISTYTCTVCGETKTESIPVLVTKEWIRLAGNGRYDTMAEIVKEGFNQTGGTVVVATGTGFKDALAAAGLAGLYDAPVILTDGKALSSQAQQQLKRLKPSQIFIAGGEAAVSKDVFDSIQKLTGVTPNRRFGQTSAGTSAALATAGKGGWSDTAIIATNKTFKDALSAAPISFSLHMPILLADNGKSLNSDVLKALKTCEIKNVIIVGGKLAVTENVESQLTKNGIANIHRIAGNTAVDTSADIATYGLNHGLTINGMGVATSQNYPDALAGAALCGHNKSVLVLADDKAMKNTSFPKNYKADFSKGYVFGGTLAVSDKVVKALEAAVK